VISRLRTKPSLDPIELSDLAGGDEPAGGADAAPALPAAALGSVQQIGYRLALILIGLLALTVIISLPLAIRSIANTWFGELQPTLYDLAADAPMAPVVTGPAAPNRSNFTLTIVNLDPMTSQATIAVSGNRICTTSCPQFDVTFFALDDNATERRGFPPPQPRSRFCRPTGSSASRSPCRSAVSRVCTRSTPMICGLASPSSSLGPAGKLSASLAILCRAGPG